MGTTCKANAAAVLYAFIKPGTPNNVPPKYRTTMMAVFVISLLSICPNIGRPAVPDGSPSSLTLKLLPSVPIR